jgi:hypothetical protein
MVKINSKLIDAIMKKSGKAKSTIYREIQIAEHTHTIEKPIAALIVAKQNNININKFASSDELTMVRDLTQSKVPNNSTIEITSPSTKQKKSRKPKEITVPQGAKSDPFLKSSDISSSESNAIIYPIMYLFENSLRRFISKCMEMDYGENWWTDKIEKEKQKIADNVKKRKLAEDDYSWHSKRNADPIYYTDINDLKNIINTYSSTGYFHNALGKNKDEVVVWVKNFEKTRNILAHNNPVSKTDLDRLKLNTNDWHAFVTGIKTKMNL